MKNTDQIKKLIKQETDRQKSGLVMIASENYCPKDILAAVGSALSNKYSEGYPGKRYYSGNQFIDQIEVMAQKSCLKMFGLNETDWSANVQPHSGSSANLAVYLGLLKPGDKILAMNLAHGGHLTHGSPVNFSGKLFNFVHYGVDPKTELLNYSQIEKIAKKEKPKMIVCGATAYSRLIDFAKFGQIAKKCNALLVADISHVTGLIVAGVHPSPFPFADVVTSTTHKTLGGPRSAFIVCRQALAKEINKAIFPGLQGGPLENIVAGKALCFERAITSEFKKIQQQTIKNAAALATELTKRGYRLVAGGTDNHLLLLDLRPQRINGKQAADALANAEIYTNANMIPYDPASPMLPSGLRLGTAALSTRGLKEKEMKIIAELIDRVLRNFGSRRIERQVATEVKKLTKKFPIY
jgi:glycine hydroxymethyltransferase